MRSQVHTHTHIHNRLLWRRRTKKPTWNQRSKILITAKTCVSCSFFHSVFMLKTFFALYLCEMLVSYSTSRLPVTIGFTNSIKYNLKMDYHDLECDFYSSTLWNNENCKISPKLFAARHILKKYHAIDIECCQSLLTNTDRPQCGYTFKTMKMNLKQP